MRMCALEFMAAAGVRALRSTSLQWRMWPGLAELLGEVHVDSALRPYRSFAETSAF